MWNQGGMTGNFNEQNFSSYLIKYQEKANQVCYLFNKNEKLHKNIHFQGYFFTFNLFENNE